MPMYCVQAPSSRALIRVSVSGPLGPKEWAFLSSKPETVVLDRDTNW